MSNEWWLGFLTAWAIIGALLFLSNRFGGAFESTQQRRHRILSTLDGAETPLPLHILMRLGGGDRNRDYGELIKMQAEGLVGAQWTTPERKARVFSIKPDGRRWLAEREQSG